MPFSLPCLVSKSVIDIFFIDNFLVYGVPHCGPWLPTTLRVLFWTYAICTFLLAVGQYYFLFTGKPLTIQSMTQAWILPVFPVMLCGTLASVMGESQSPEHSLPIQIAGVTFQGLGMLTATFMYSPYLAWLMTSGLPSPNTRPGML
jgi:tellurite resistance protein TehA-like permease